MFKVEWDFETTAQIESRSQAALKIPWENDQIWANKWESIEPTVIDEKLEFVRKLSRENWPNTWSGNRGAKKKDGNLIFWIRVYIHQNMGY